MKEIWKDIPGYEGLYQASSFGKVRSLNYYGHKGKIQELKPGLVKKYLSVVLSKNGKNKKFLIHQLVAMTFLKHKPCGMELVVDHKNDNGSDNRLGNLQIITQRKNSSRTRSQKTGLPVGVSKFKNKFQSKIRINSKQKHLGYFNTLEEASQAYQQALKNLN